MKNLVTFVSVIILSASLLAQAPQMFSYQAVVRGVNNELVANKLVGMKISLLQGSESGSAVFIETHKPTANENGLVSIVIGGGTLVKGTFANIDWSKGPYFIKTETDPAGGTNYGLSTISQLLSVPYAIHAKTAENIIGGGNILPSGGENGQSLTICDGVPTWTTGGLCPGKIKGLSCNFNWASNATVNFTAESPLNFSCPISYNGGNGGYIASQKVSSTGLTGLTASLNEGFLANGEGILNYMISGIPTTSGIATFTISVGDKTCFFSIPVKEAIKVSDVDGNTYKTVVIGNQIWIAENLKVTKYNDGTVIPNITDSAKWTKLNTGAFSYFNNDLTNNTKYGKLYNWYAVNPTSNGGKNVCPVDWHVPKINEWNTLISYLGGEKVAGGKMKEVGTINWNKPNTDASNSTLFSALPGGFRDDLGNYGEIGEIGGWWSSTEVNNSTLVLGLVLESQNVNIEIVDINKVFGLSIRCIKD